MTELFVRASMGTTSAWNELAPAFTRLTGHKSIVTQESSTTLDHTLASNAPADLMVLYTDPMNDIIRRGKVLEGSSAADAPMSSVDCPFQSERQVIMRGVGLFEFGGAEVLRVVDLPETHATAGEVRIRVHASTVNPTDTYLRKGARAEALRKVLPPYVPGMDVAGVVDEIGDGTATDLAIGDSVMAMVVNSGSHGGYRESIVLPADCVVRAPAGATLIEAATLPMNGLTARQSLDQLALRPGQSLAVTGAAGCYGGYVVQLAKADGLHVIADASSADAALVRSLGADSVVPRGDDIAAQIRKVAPHGVDGLADGSFQSGLAVGAVRDGGGFASVRGWSGDERGIAFHRTSVRDYDHRADLLDRLRQQVEDALVTLRIAATFPPGQAAEAHRRLEAKGTRGRLVLVWTPNS